ncbi:MAG: phosphopantetheine-binding protein [Polycyclovorans sp.]|jgi:acyl carrier protein|nr:acyl carrier protein [Polycyclovorans sp.]MBU0790857.1 acyl carrier protein [Gammaproteobacteria bacterium]MDP1542586.1 phosphopantetheine-binding protein [Polycyclovorans sp.]MEC8849955.1 phosphopantetheine-binding protein [Pseudomonadota bacterium]|tara:strand:- start:48 stop:332 length:285 start_codon:yes stop_codon:yes gene_type:complete
MTTADALIQPLITLLEDFTQDWDTEPDAAMNGDTRLLADLGFESIDIIQLTVALEETFGLRKVPFDQLLMQDGRYVDDLSLRQIATFLQRFINA